MASICKTGLKENVLVENSLIGVYWNMLYDLGESVTAAIPVTRFWGEVLAHSANSIALLNGTFND